MNNEQKIKIFETSCNKLLNKDKAELNKIINSEIEAQIKEELKEYEKKEEMTYHKKLEKLEKDYHKQLYVLDMKSKQEVLNQKKIFQKELNDEVTQILSDFTNKSEYKEFLMNRINEVTEKVGDSNTAVIRVVKKDYDKYADEIYSRFHIKVESMENDYIGGCILEDKLKGLYIEHTIQNSIDEKLENELR